MLWGNITLKKIRSQHFYRFSNVRSIAVLTACYIAESWSHLAENRLIFDYFTCNLMLYACCCFFVLTLYTFW